jgi:hypothetical protein
MATITVGDGRLRVRFTTLEKVLGLVHDLDLPLSAVLAAERMPDWKAVRGFRVGLGMPWLWLLGTWRWRGHRQLVALRRGQPAVRIQLAGANYDEVVVEASDPDDLLRVLPPAVSIAADGHETDAPKPTPLIAHP